MEQPRVNPSDWASRRQHAMNRAKELRSKLKEQEHGQPPSSTERSVTSKADLQRQRRSRQLEETQRLLDGHDLNFDNFSFKSDAAKREVAPRTKQQEFQRKCDNDRVGTHSVISKEQLGRIHGRYTEGSGMSDNSLEKNAPTIEKRQKEVANARDSIARSNNQAHVSSSLPSMPESTVSLRERPIEGRGRGRGRGRSATANSHTSSLGEMSQSSRSISHSVKHVSSGLTRTMQQSSVDKSHRGSSSKPFLAYLRERQVPGYKEGECDKLAILRQKLVARRNKRGKPSTNKGKENNTSKANAETTSRKGDKPNPSNARDSYAKHDEIHGDSSATRSQQRSKASANNRKTNPPSPHSLSLDDVQSVPSSVSSRTARSQASQEASVHQNNMFGNIDGVDDDSVLEIELIECDCCKRSFAPKVYEKHFDQDGQPKCASQMSKKRAVFNSAKARIANNDNLNRDEQMQIIQTQKQVAKELAKKKKSSKSSKKSKKGSKWREESNAFREAMKANRLITKAEREGKPAHYYL